LWPFHGSPFPGNKLKTSLPQPAGCLLKNTYIRENFRLNDVQLITFFTYLRKYKENTNHINDIYQMRDIFSMIRNVTFVYGARGNIKCVPAQD
jgi:hypothetical protein